MKVYKISAITLSVKNMEKSCKFYSGIPGFKIVYGGSNYDTFTTFKIGEDITMYLNLELRTNTKITTTHVNNPYYNLLVPIDHLTHYQHREVLVVSERFQMYSSWQYFSSPMIN